MATPSLYSSLARRLQNFESHCAEKCPERDAVRSQQWRGTLLAPGRDHDSQPSTARGCGFFHLRKKTPGAARPGGPRRQVRGVSATQLLQHRRVAINPAWACLHPRKVNLGTHGYSLRMDGLEPGFNDQARDRAIVIHAADYVSPLWSKREGLYRPQPGVARRRARRWRAKVVDKLKDGAVYVFRGTRPALVEVLDVLNCKPQQVASSRQNWWPVPPHR